MAQGRAGDVQPTLSSGCTSNASLLQLAELPVWWWCFYVSHDIPSGLHSCLPRIFIHACSFAFISG